MIIIIVARCALALVVAMADAKEWRKGVFEGGGRDPRVALVSSADELCDGRKATAGKRERVSQAVR